MDIWGQYGWKSGGGGGGGGGGGAERNWTCIYMYHHIK